jgi:hypothetical protein
MTLVVPSAQEEEQSAIYPVQFVQIGELHDIAVPLVRITTCGLIRLEILQEVVSHNPPLGRYKILSPLALRGRGLIPALTLLKLLLSQPQQFALTDWLLEQMRSHLKTVVGENLYDEFSHLRDLLCGLEKRADLKLLRPHLAMHLNNREGSGPGYQIAPYPLIWLDTVSAPV